MLGNEYNNPESGTIAGKYNYVEKDYTKKDVSIGSYYVDLVKCVLRIEVKDDRARITIKMESYHEYMDALGGKADNWQAATLPSIEKVAFKEHCASMTKGLETYVKDEAASDF